MKKFRLVLAILALVLVFGLVLAGCKSEADGPFEGTWKQVWNDGAGTAHITYTFAGSDFSCSFESPSSNRIGSFAGTFSYTGTTITFTVPAYEETWTQDYTMSGLSLTIVRDAGGHFNGTFIKQ
jgi:hypothetical protein